MIVAAFGAAMVIVRAFWIASPFLIVEGMGPGNKMEGPISARLLIALAFPGLLPIGFGLLLIWQNR